MIDTFSRLFRLRTAYRANGVLWFLKSLPLLKRILPPSLYSSSGLKTFAYVFGILTEIGTIFFGKLLYAAAMFFLPLSAFDQAGNGNAWFHLLLFLTIAGGVINTQLFQPGKERYYAIFLLRMDAKKVSLADFFYTLGKTLIGFLPLAIIFTLPQGVPALCRWLIPVYVVSVKLIAGMLVLRRSAKHPEPESSLRSNTRTTLWTLLPLIFAYLPVAFGYVLPWEVFAVCAVPALAGGIYAIFYLYGFKQYRLLCKQVYANGSFLQTDISTNAQNLQTTYQKKLDYNQTQHSDKKGYAYLNDLFVKRHRRLLWRSAVIIALIAVGVVAVAIAVCYLLPEKRAELNALLMNSLPYFLFVLYFVNRGARITQALFINCDRSMLTYRFYRQPKAILQLFSVRLRSVILINLLPASPIALGLPLLLLCSGGTEQIWIYPLMLVSILAMSVFFSVHTLVLYYLLQPYNAGIEMKNPLYSFISLLTYLLCFSATNVTISTPVFCCAITAFTLLYVAVSLLLIYRRAPKTFRLR